MALTDLDCKNAKLKERDYKLSDDKGLFLQVKANGAKYWRLKYRINGKEKLLALGVYPEVTLKSARTRRDQAREQIANGIDPGEYKKQVRANRSEAAANTLQHIVTE